MLAAGNPDPNPAGELSYLELNSSVSGKALVEVTDLQGCLIFRESKEMTNRTNRIDIATGNLRGARIFSGSVQQDTSRFNAGLSNKTSRNRKLIP